MAEYGYCHCGCGAKTNLAKATDPRYGWIKGEPVQYVRGHGRRGKVKREWLVDENGCWLWQLGKTTAGYGRTSEGGKEVYVHRLHYEQKHGPIPDGKELDHLCRNRACCNPDHLEPVTHRENMERGFYGSKTECVHGHAYTPENTYVVAATGARQCRTCTRERYEARKAVAA